MSNIKLLRTLVFLLEQEVLSLRSVLSEYDGDKMEFTQMVRAQIIRDAIEALGGSGE